MTNDAREYRKSPEAKCADAFGNICDHQTIGLLQRRHIKIDLIKCIGKESNSLEAVDEGLQHSQKNVYTEYVDLKSDEWSTKILPAPKKVPLKTLVTTLKGRPSRSTVIELRAGRSRPHRKSQELLAGILKQLKLI